ncbi:MAG: hypothetical protein QM523_11540 [Candidatus Pacebacteria bacterium]|nr:hypothetical protein [Candidatus Paceibacterota bacterium]
MKSKFLTTRQLNGLARVTGRRIILAVSASLVSSLMAASVMAGTENSAGKPSPQSQTTYMGKMAAKDNVTASQNSLAPARRVDGTGSVPAGAIQNRDSGKKSANTASQTGSSSSQSAAPAKASNQTSSTQSGGAAANPAAK